MRVAYYSHYPLRKIEVSQSTTRLECARLMQKFAGSLLSDIRCTEMSFLPHLRMPSPEKWQKVIDNQGKSPRKHKFNETDVVKETIKAI